MTTPTLEKNIMRPKRFGQDKREKSEYEERVLEVARISRVVKGGRRIRFRALVVIGDQKGKVGMGVAKANEVADAVKKAVAQAKKHLIEVPIISGTIPHEIIVKSGGARIMLKPASSGTSVVAGGSVRVVCELAGITDILSKIQGSPNKINNVTATLKALSSFSPKAVEMRRKYEKTDKKIDLIKQEESEKEKTEEKVKPEIIKEDKVVKEKAETPAKSKKIAKKKPAVTEKE